MLPIKSMFVDRLSAYYSKWCILLFKSAISWSHHARLVTLQYSLMYSSIYFKLFIICLCTIFKSLVGEKAGWITPKLTNGIGISKIYDTIAGTSRILIDRSMLTKASTISSWYWCMGNGVFWWANNIELISSIDDPPWSPLTVIPWSPWISNVVSLSILLTIVAIISFVSLIFRSIYYEKGPKLWPALSTPHMWATINLNLLPLSSS